MGFSLRITTDSGEILIFQFPLWDSKVELVEIIEPKKPFQFPLWDS